MSQVPWAPSLPSAWETARLKDVVRLTNGFPFDSERFSPDDGVPLIRIRDLLRGHTETRYTGSVPSDMMVQPGDLLIGMDGDFNAVVWRGEPGALNQRICRLRSRGLIDSRYLAYLVPLSLEHMNRLTPLTTVKHLSSLDLLNQRIPSPPRRAQEAIADFLDRETAHIDELVSRKRQLAELLRQRVATISADVVGRLVDANRLIDSGIPSVGSVPAHWQLCRNKDILSETQEVLESGEGELLSVSHLTGVTPRSEKDVYMFMAESLVGYKMVRRGDLVINTMWAWMGALGVSSTEGVVSPGYGVYRFDRTKALPSYYDVFYRTPAYVTEMTRFSRGVWTSRLRLYPEVFLGLRTVVPPLAEQEAIVSVVNQSTRKSTDLIDLLGRSVDSLLMRRQNLVTAAVTGRIDVSNGAA